MRPRVYGLKPTLKLVHILNGCLSPNPDSSERGLWSYLQCGVTSLTYLHPRQCTMPKEAKRGCQILWNQSYRWLWAAMWLLATAPQSVQEQVLLTAVKSTVIQYSLYSTIPEVHSFPLRCPTPEFHRSWDMLQETSKFHGSWFSAGMATATLPVSFQE